jgi:hypothetical protein
MTVIMLIPLGVAVILTVVYLVTRRGAEEVDDRGSLVH